MNLLRRHPRLTIWAVLALGMVLILLWATSDQGYAPGQLAALIVTCVALAGACAAIIGWA